MNLSAIKKQLEQLERAHVSRGDRELSMSDSERALKCISILDAGRRPNGDKFARRAFGRLNSFIHEARQRKAGADLV